ncbi:MAG TPA: GH116 family glycosyl-hydrolase, partial [Isosphaeraceae bacterium]|nr:GH116 family glycosyl-hydrolase [Isosphaeraceae bacterium]
MEAWPVLSRYDAAHVRELAMPIGGIGTGFFALGGRGQLTDWQLMSRPNRGWRPMYAHLLLRTRQGTGRDEVIKLRVIEGDLVEGLAGDSGAAGTLAGLPRFRNVSFEASYPLGRALLTDPDTPVTVAIEGFNPLIPHETDASSLPMGLLTVSLKNTTDAPLDASVTLLLSNIVGTDGIVHDLKDNITERASVGSWKGMQFSKNHPPRTARDGTMAIVCDQPDVRVARRWPFRDRPWNGEALGIMDSLLHTGFIADDEPDKPCPPSPNDTWDSSLSALLALKARETLTVRLLITWHFPLRNLEEEGWWSGEKGSSPIVGNYYATKFADARDVARHVIERLPDLHARTLAFVKSVVDRAAPHALKEAALFNLTSLRSHTCFRLADGTFAAFEGCNANSGCCNGSCTHVWNYEEASVHLFPDLHRSMLESHLKHGVTAEGAERFRLSLPVANPTWKGAAADGQMGLIVRVYEQYLADKDAGGLAWLKQVYPSV